MLAYRELREWCDAAAASLNSPVSGSAEWSTRIRLPPS